MSRVGRNRGLGRAFEKAVRREKRKSGEGIGQRGIRRSGRYQSEDGERHLQRVNLVRGVCRASAQSVFGKPILPVAPIRCSMKRTEASEPRSMTVTSARDGHNQVKPPQTTVECTTAAFLRFSGAR